MKLVSANDLYLLLISVFLKAVSPIPSLRVKQFIADCIATIAFGFSRKKRRRSEASIVRVLVPAPTQLQTRAIVQAAFHEFWRDVFSVWLSDGERVVLKQAEIQGIEHLHAALQKGSGVALLESSFFGSRNRAKQILHELGISVHQVHGERHLAGFQIGENTFVQSHLLRPFFEKYEKQFIADIIYLPSSESLAYTRRFLSILQTNAILCVSADGRMGHKHIPVQFLGRMELFPTGMMSLAKISGASLLPIFCLQTENGRLRLVVERPLQIEKSIEREQGVHAALTEYVRLLESYIQKYPGAYRNWHSLSD